MKSSWVPISLGQEVLGERIPDSGIRRCRTKIELHLRFQRGVNVFIRTLIRVRSPRTTFVVAEDVAVSFSLTLHRASLVPSLC